MRWWGARRRQRRTHRAHIPNQRSADFVALLRTIDDLYGPRPGRSHVILVIVLDNGPIHTSKEAMAGLAARPWLRVERLPKYTPELNWIERSWRDLKRHHLAHRTFCDIDDLDAPIHEAVADLNRERAKNPRNNLRIAA